MSRGHLYWERRHGYTGALLRDVWVPSHVEAWLVEEQRWQEFPEGGIVPEGAWRSDEVVSDADA